MSADVVLIGGRVWSSGSATVSELALRGGRVLAVGEAARAAVGATTTVVDLEGRFVCPGFQDAHVHPAHGGRALLTCDLLDAVTAQEGLARIRAYGEASSGWVTGSGWKYEWFQHGEPSVELLDELVGDRPAYLTVADGHSGWANSAALARAGITEASTDPVDGRIARGPDGRPQGTLHEGAMTLVERVVPPPSPDELEEALLAGQAHLLSFGITAWQDADVSPELHEAYLRIAGDGRLRASVRGALWWERDEGLEQLERMKERRAEAAGRYSADAVKLMLDGVVENHTAKMLEPYLDGSGHLTDRCGLDMLDPGSLPAAVSEIMAAGFQPHFHAIGDGSVRLALDSVEMARAQAGTADTRPHIAHVQVVHPDDVPRFGTLGVTPNLQALWAVNDAAMADLTVPFLGSERASWQYPFAALASAAGRVGMGSDWSVSTPDVLAQISVAVRRQPPLRSDVDPFLPEQAMTVEQVLTGFTAGSAWVNGLEAERGTLGAGKVADLVVLTDDPRRVEDPAAVTVSATLIGGEVVFGHL